jgi:hypothetical protein
MMSINDTLIELTDKTFTVSHPYASFTFTTNSPKVCSGVLYLSIWDLKGKVTFNGNNWYEVENLKPKEGDYVEYYYDSIFKDTGWVYQDIHVTLTNIINKSIIKTFKIISISNKKYKDDYHINCGELSKLNKSLLTVLDDVRLQLNKVIDVDSVYFTEEQIMIIDIIDQENEEINLLTDSVNDRNKETVFKLEEKILNTLKPMGIKRYSIGKIHKP